MTGQGEAKEVLCHRHRARQTLSVKERMREGTRESEREGERE